MYRNTMLVFLLFILHSLVLIGGEPVLVETRHLTESELYGLEFIDESKLFAHLNYIASNHFEGREATERGQELASEYAAALFRMWGLQPVGDDLDIHGWQGPSYFQKFNVIEFQHLPTSSLIIDTQQGTTRYKTDFSFETDFTIGFGVSDNVTISAPIVFAGYGLEVPDENFNELRNIDVKDKIILLSRGVPRSDDESLVWNQSAQRFRYANMRTRIERLREQGAAGVLVVPSYREDDLYSQFVQNVDHHHPRFNRYYEGDEPLETRRRMRLADREQSGIPVFNITRAVANTILASTGKTITQIQKEIDDNLRPQSVNLNNVTASMQPRFHTKVLWTNNVVGLLEGSDPGLKNEVIVVGAHYDHDGQRSGFIWNGADDNGSGTSGVLTLAHTLTTAPERPKRSILFALWGAEEKGLLGSNYFMDNPVVPLENIITKKNLDMIGRDQNRPETGTFAADNKNQVFLTLSEQLPLLEKVTKENNELIGLDITMRITNATGGGSDHAPFARRGIPISFFFTGFHEDYHQPSDTVDKINFEKMAKIVRLAYLNLWSLANYEGDVYTLAAD
jgi:hypothetical protein